SRRRRARRDGAPANQPGRRAPLPWCLSATSPGLSWLRRTSSRVSTADPRPAAPRRSPLPPPALKPPGERSEEHTSELQSRENLVCRLLLEKKKQHTQVL